MDSWALSESDFRRLFLGQAVSGLGDQITPVALAFAVLELTGSTTDLGVVLAAASLPMLCSLLAGGVVADRLARQRVMLFSDIVRAAAQGMTALLLIAGTAEVWQLIVLQALYGSAVGFFRPAALGLVPQVVSTERLQQANALMGFTRDIGLIGGPAIAGVMVTAFTPGWGLALDAATFVISACFLARMRVNHRPREQTTGFISELREGWQAFSSRTWLWASVAYFAFFVGFVSGPFEVLGPVVARNELGGASAWAAIVTSTGVGALAGGAAALRIRPRNALFVSILAFVALWAPQLVLVAVPAPTAVIAVGAFLAGAAMTFATAVWETALQSNVPPDSLSRVSSYDWLCSIALQPIGYALTGPLVASIGVRATLVAGAIGMTVTSLMVLSVPAVRRLEDGSRAAPRPAAAAPDAIVADLMS